VNSTLGRTMNSTWYYGISEGNETIPLSSNINFTNSTINSLFFTASNRFTDYYWKLEVDDGTITKNQTYQFRTEGYNGVGGVGIISTNIYGILGIMGLIVGIIVLVILMINKRKEQDF